MPCTVLQASLKLSLPRNVLGLAYGRLVYPAYLSHWNWHVSAAHNMMDVFRQIEERSNENWNLQLLLAITDEL
jgi:predicted SnoaL-like aldol condensation-catalyzing enzyme